jgi:hypothetical protein
MHGHTTNQLENIYLWKLANLMTREMYFIFTSTLWQIQHLVVIYDVYITHLIHKDEKQKNIKFQTIT